MHRGYNCKLIRTSQIDLTDLHTYGPKGRAPATMLFCQRSLDNNMISIYPVPGEQINQHDVTWGNLASCQYDQTTIKNYLEIHPTILHDQTLFYRPLGHLLSAI